MIPSKKVLTLILVSILIVTGAFVFAEYKNKQTLTGEYTADSTNILTAQNSIDTYKDSDGDGLKDWEELLWGTDPKIADADKKDAKTVVLNKKTESLTATDKLARTFFSQYMNLKEVGLQNDKDSQERVAKNLLADINFTQTPAPYTENDIKISTTLGLREYGNTIGSIFKNNLVPGRNEVAILQNALTLGNREVLKELDPIVAGYKNIRTGLLTTAVPSQAVSSHISLLNSLNKIIFLVELLSKTFTDPAVGIQGVALYQPTFVELQQSFESMRSVFKNAGITFTSSEPGIFFQPQ
jgi:hypothetical protein